MADKTGISKCTASRRQSFAQPVSPSLIVHAQVRWKSLLLFFASAFHLLPHIGFSAEELPPIKDLSIWDGSVQIRSAIGYKDNVLLSPAGREQSTFIKAGAEVLVWRLPTDGTQFSVFASGSDTRFLDSVSAQREQLGIVSARVEHQFNQRLVAGVSMQYIYQDQVFDVSATEPILRTVRLRGHGLSPRLFMKYQLAAKWWMESELGLTRQYLDAPLDDYWEYGLALSVHFKPAPASELSVKSTLANRSYDQRSVLRGGANLPGSESLEFFRSGAEITWIQTLDQKGRWRLKNSLGLQRSEDNGNGFFDYNRYALQKQLVYAGSKWRFSLEGDLYYYDFENQPVSLSLPQMRERANLTLGLGIYRRINRYLKAGLEGEQESSFSNELNSDYLAHTVSLNLVFEF